MATQKSTYNKETGLLETTAYFSNAKGEPCDEKDATKIEIYVFNDKGEVVDRVYGNCKPSR